MNNLTGFVEVTVATSWTSEQVVALAPDPASAKAGQGLATPKKWVTLGANEGVLWGECQGSGASPYQTKIDLGEPAFHCSCPSRKFPCKHGLGLFLLHVGQASAFQSGEPPAWVTSWLEGRSKRADQKAQKEKAAQESRERGEPAVDPEAKRKREAARAAKVVAGLDELGLWLGDLMRQGLASAQSRPADFWEERARRLVDAQAPGVARRLLRIDSLPTSGEGWQDALLEHLGRLHLLLEGHRRLDALPPEIQADVRVAVGYPVDQDEVRSGPGVRDTWAVVAQRVVQDVQDRRLRIQRTWLIGRTTGRPALVLEFAFANQALDASLVPASALDAELAFFPGNLPLRALVKTRHGVPEALESLGGQRTIAEALATYAEALARNVWLEAFPIVLDEVLIQPRDGGWVVRDAAGAVLPVSPSFDRGWHLLALGAGRPLGLAGEFDGDVFDPLSAHVAGRFVALSGEAAESRPTGPPPVEAEPSLAATWRAAAASALVGLDRRPLAPHPADDPLHRLSGRLDAAEPSARLLGITAAASLFGRAGRKPPADPTPPPEPCGPDDQPECGPEPARRLRRLLSNEFPEALPEWLGLLETSGRRVPNDLLTEALSLGRSRSDLRDALRRVLGTRGRWLAAQNPDWSYFGGEADRADPDRVWATGAKAERLVALRTLRAKDPDRAREVVMSTWGAESADDRVAFVEALAAGLSMADEPFLEAALDDRSKLVRAAAAPLLTRLPESRLSRRMAERARPLVHWDGKSLAVTLPKECDTSMVRDGLTPKPPIKLGERAWWLRQVVGATPTSAWTEDGATPEQLVEAICKEEWQDVLWTGWAEAAIRERDPRWALALLDREPATTSEIRGAGFAIQLLGVLPAEARDAFLLAALRSDPGPLMTKHPAFGLIRSALTGVRFGVPLAREVLRRAREIADGEAEELRRPQSDKKVKSAAPPYDPRNRDYGVYYFFDELGGRLPVELLEEAERGWPREVVEGQYYGSAYRQLLDKLRFRREMYQEFAP